MSQPFSAATTQKIRVLITAQWASSDPENGFQLYVGDVQFSTVPAMQMQPAAALSLSPGSQCKPSVSSSRLQLMLHGMQDKRKRWVNQTCGCGHRFNFRCLVDL